MILFIAVLICMLVYVQSQQYQDKQDSIEVLLNRGQTDEAMTRIKAEISSNRNQSSAMMINLGRAYVQAGNIVDRHVN